MPPSWLRNWWHCLARSEARSRRGLGSGISELVTFSPRSVAWTEAAVRVGLGARLGGRPRGLVRLGRHGGALEVSRGEVRLFVGRGSVVGVSHVVAHGG